MIKTKLFNVLLPVLILLFILQVKTVHSQHYWVYFTDKDGVTFDPYSYFDPHTLERRLKNHQPLATISDYPVKPMYLRAVSSLADSTGFASRWFNAVAVTASEEQIQTIAQLPFVAGYELSSAVYPMLPASEHYDSSMISAHGNLLEKQVETLGLGLFRAAGIDGKGIRVAVFDGGFPTYRTNLAFAHILADNRILQTWDFTRNHEDVDRGINHGTRVLSCIAGMINGKPMGLATGASFLLAITEVRTEPFREEQNWLAAAEWADRHGADLINSSLGYTNNRYFNDQMDGKNTLVTRAANMAAAKGMLVVNAAGNEGEDRWHIIGAPADADSVLAVGGIDPETGYHTGFSSYGPTYDRRMKPNVVAFGHVMAAGKNKLVKTQGTSFASPLVAGFAACAWQARPDLTNMELFRMIEKSGHLYPYFDYAHGFGIPGAATFVGVRDTAGSPAFSLEVDQSGYFTVRFMEDNREPGERERDSYLYLHIRNAGGEILRYFVLAVTSPVLSNKDEILEYDIPALEKGQTICAHYRAYTSCVTMENSNEKPINTNE